MPAEDLAKLKLDNVRLSFPDLWEPRSVNKSEPKYAAHFLFDATERADLVKLIRQRIYAAAVAHWGEEKAKKICGSKKFEHCLHDGSEKENMAGYGELDENDDWVSNVKFVTCSSTRRPLVIDRDRSPLTKDDGRPYGGCYVNAILRLWVQDNQFGQRVNAELMGVQFFKDGESFGGAVPATPDDFEDFGDAGEGDGKAKAKAKQKGGKKPAKGDPDAPADDWVDPDAEPDEDEIPF